MAIIESLKPSVSLAEAQRLLSTDGFRGVLRYMRYGRFRWLAQVYIPFDTFSLEIHRNGMIEGGFIAVDAVNGTLDPYSFEHSPAETDCVAVETRNALPRVLAPRLSQENAEQRVRRLLYQRGFFRISNLKITAHRQPLSFYVPYWVGFFGSNSELGMVAIDAVRRQLEGAKVRVMLQQWFTGELPLASDQQQIATAS